MFDSIGPEFTLAWLERPAYSLTHPYASQKRETHTYTSSHTNSHIEYTESVPENLLTSLFGKYLVVKRNKLKCFYSRQLTIVSQ